jgi:glycosyltransferase involved in cell wall biosynthesis
MPSTVGVMQLVDSLAIGGAEQVAVNLANHLPHERFQMHLGTTRKDGPLSRNIATHVGRLSLNRKGRFDMQALWQLPLYIRAHHITLLHAHSTSLFAAVFASFFSPYPKILWHDHFGPATQKTRPARLYKLVSRRIGGVIAVSHPLKAWSIQHLSLPACNVWYVPNFVELASEKVEPVSLPGDFQFRIVCVANLRPEKDHPTLLRALVSIRRQIPGVQLILVGASSSEVYLAHLRAMVADLDLTANVSFLGARTDVPAILRASAVGVLSSLAEGLPLALLEYGAAGLPVVCTDVGQCREVLDNGRAGLLVPAGDSVVLAHALANLLQDDSKKHLLGAQLQQHVAIRYSSSTVLRQVMDIYDTLLGCESRRMS